MIFGFLLTFFTVFRVFLFQLFLLLLYCNCNCSLTVAVAVIKIDDDDDDIGLQRLIFHLIVNCLYKTAFAMSK